MKVIVGGYEGIPLTEEDAVIYKRRMASGCFIHENAYYDRSIKQVVPVNDIYVIDFRDNEYVNFALQEE